MAEKKITAREYFEAIKTFVEENGGDAGYIDFLNTQIENLAKRAEKAKERRAAKAAEPDPYIDAIAKCIGDEPVTADEIVATLDIEDLTRNKVVARVNKLEGIEKVEVKFENEDGKTVKRVAYKRA